ncbi:hypothetical protein ES707_01944 [subsurface metagenome]
MSLMTAAPASAGITTYTDAVLEAADNLAALQNDDGGFDWGQPDGDPATGSCTNTLGITAMGILKAYELEDKAAYETALAKAYKYAVDNPPGWTGEEETTKGVDSFPDVTFMTWLAMHATHDTSLLGAIQTQVPGTTAASIAALAKTRWDDRVTNLGPSATGMAEYVRDARHDQGWDTLIPWDLEAAVKAALALNAYYPGEGYDTQAISIATVIYNSVDDAAGTYFNSGDTSQEDYVAGLTGAIEAFQEVGLYPEKVAALKVLLLNVQDGDGFWKYHGATPADMSVQNTAYAVMALLSQGESDAVAAAEEAVDWLLSAQTLKGDGGWFAEGGAGAENLEVDSEAAWAIKAMVDRFSGSVGMIAGYTPQIGISVRPTWVDFGDVVPGAPSGTRHVSIHNYGNVNVGLTAEIINESPTGVYTAPSPGGLTIDGTSIVVGWSYTPLVPCTPKEVELVLTVPSGTAPGSYTATLVFWAEQAP